MVTDWWHFTFALASLAASASAAIDRWRFSGSLTSLSSTLSTVIPHGFVAWMSAKVICQHQCQHICQRNLSTKRIWGYTLSSIFRISSEITSRSAKISESVRVPKMFLRWVLIDSRTSRLQANWLVEKNISLKPFLRVVIASCLVALLQSCTFCIESFTVILSHWV